MSDSFHSFLALEAPPVPAPAAKARWADESDDDSTAAGSSEESDDLGEHRFEGPPGTWAAARRGVAPRQATPRGKVSRPRRRCPSCDSSSASESEVPLEGLGGRTTITVKNLPSDTSREALMDMLNSQGLKDLYDFVYLPFDLRARRALGYATVNMESSYVADLAMQLLKGISYNGHTLDVCWNSTHQGIDELVKFYRNSRSMHESVAEEFRPILLQCGLQVPFPAPTRAIRKPFS